MAWYYSIFVLSIVVPVIAYRKKSLNLIASFLAFLMIIFAITVSPKHATFLISAFLFVSVIDKVCRKKLKTANEDITQKSGTRDAIQVLANGGIAMICILLWHITKKDFFLLGFASSLIESFGDSVASDVGIAAKQQTYDICHFRKITSGLSGGITMAGTFGCLIACTLMSYIAFIFNVAHTPKELVLLIMASFFGCIFDSILGSLIQRKNKCAICGKITEKTFHCSVKTEYHSGISFINNDVVNLLCNAFSAAAIILLV